jgi:hypothetical protein
LGRIVVQTERQPDAITTLDQDDVEFRLRKLPPEIGTLLVVAGIAGIILPGPVGSPLLIAGGVVLWPGTFERIEDWYRRRFPQSHRSGMRMLGRFIEDLERRYPGTTGPEISS